MQVVEPTIRRWTRDEYYQMLDMGLFQDQRVELIDGEIVDMAPQKDVHSAVVSLTAKAIARAFGEGYWVRTQFPLSLGIASDPEPDVSVVPGTERDYIGTGHPTTALLIVEVSDTTLRYDRGRKASLYASAGVADYWIINLVARQVEVYRTPMPDSAEPHGHRYAESKVFQATERVAPLARPGQAVAAADVLP